MLLVSIALNINIGNTILIHHKIPFKNFHEKVIIIFTTVSIDVNGLQRTFGSKIDGINIVMII